MAVRRVSIEERRARLGLRHRLAPSGSLGALPGVVGGLIGLHATDPATVFLSARARIEGFEVQDLERALYEDRALVRMLAMRRTMWVVARDDVDMVQAGAADAVAAAQRRRLLRELASADLGGARPEPWLDALEEKVCHVLAEQGELTGAQLGRSVPELRTSITISPGKPYGGEVSITSQVLNLMSMRGKLVRGRPLGDWNSTRYRWALRERWLPEERWVPTEEARVALVRRWLAGFGPGTLEDLKWWTGLPVTAIRTALKSLRVTEVQLAEGVGYLLTSDQEPVRSDEPWVALLPSLDPTVMGWRHRDWYLGPHRDALFDRSGNAGPTVWVDGRVVGGWGQRPNGAVAYRLLEDVGRWHRDRIEQQAEHLTAWLGAVRVIPRFRTPVEKDLAER